MEYFIPRFDDQEFAFIFCGLAFPLKAVSAVKGAAQP
jgi:hypothetical protein